MLTSRRWISRHASGVTRTYIGRLKWDDMLVVSLSGEEDDADVPLYPEHQRGRSAVRNGQALHPGGSVRHTFKHLLKNKHLIVCSPTGLEINTASVFILG